MNDLRIYIVPDFIEERNLQDEIIHMLNKVHADQKEINVIFDIYYASSERERAHILTSYIANSNPVLKKTFEYFFKSVLKGIKKSDIIIIPNASKLRFEFHYLLIGYLLGLKKKCYIINSLKPEHNELMLSLIPEISYTENVSELMAMIQEFIFNKVNETRITGETLITDIFKNDRNILDAVSRYNSFATKKIFFLRDFSKMTTTAFKLMKGIKTTRRGKITKVLNKLNIKFKTDGE